MLAKLVETPPTGDGWQYELKLDGYRAQVVKSGKTVEVFSRRGNSFMRKYPTIAAAFEHLAPETVLDGEIVALDEEGPARFSNAAKRAFEASLLLRVRYADSRGPGHPGITAR